MFIRVKKIKNNEYAYLVETKRHGKNVKQKVLKYLGKIYMPKKIYNLSLANTISDVEDFIKKHSYKEVFLELLKIELLNHDFKQEKQRFFNECYVDLNLKKVYDAEFRECVVKLNNGFLCDITLENLFNFVPVNDENILAQELARVLIEAGINIDNETFICLFNKIMENFINQTKKQ